MIYEKEDYLKECDLIVCRIERVSTKRNYPKKYLKLVCEATEQMFSLFNFKPNKELLTHPDVLRAFELAEKCHADQERKYTFEPYFVHLREVASIVSSLEDSTHHEVIAAILHDVVEKGNISLEFIKENFGDIVSNYVDYLSDDRNIEAMNRKERIKNLFTEFTKGPNKVNNLKAIDILSNTRSTILCDARYGATYLEPIIEYMNPYFQKSEFVHPKIKEILQSVCDISENLIQQQRILGIHKIEKQCAEQERKIRKEKKAQSLIG